MADLNMINTSNLGRTSAMKIAIVSHSYQDLENQKNIIAFEKFAAIQVVLQKNWKNWLGILALPRDNVSSYIYFKSVYLFGSQYLLLTMDMGFKSFRPDIILIEYNPWSIIFFQTLIAKLFFCPNAKIVCLIKKNTFKEKSGFYGLLRRWIAAKSLAMTDHILAASRMVSNLLQKRFEIPEHKIDIVHHLGVDTDLFSPNQSAHSKETVIIGYVGRLELHKGVLDLINAVKIIKQTYINSPSVRLYFLGEGSLKPALKAMMSDLPWLEIYPAVPISEVPNFMHLLDIFVLPSRNLEDHQEHDAHALMEAMSIGLACIGCRSGIIPEILEDGTGLLVNTESPKELADALKYLIDNADVRIKLGQSARRKAEKEFSNDLVAQKKYELFLSLVKGDM
jgi:glycosyltransferase involved in cell wall biosynthesis